MKRTLAIAGITTTLIVPMTTQDQAGMAERRPAVELLAQAGGLARTALETRVTRGKPYTAEAVTEFIQVLGDGNRIVRRSTARLFRDSEGRTRREAVHDAGTTPDTQSAVITDPVTGTSIVLDPNTRTAFKSPAMFARVQAAPAQAGAVTVIELDPAEQPKVPIVPGDDGALKRQAGMAAGFTVYAPSGAVSTFTVGSGALGAATSSGGGETTRDDLGSQDIEGVTARGTRTTTVIPAGAVGNEQPITVVSEQWFSPELEMLLLTRHSDPRVGETTYRLMNIGRAEPDRMLFQVPPDYAVRDRQPLMMQPLMMRRQQ